MAGEGACPLRWRRTGAIKAYMVPAARFELATP